MIVIAIIGILAAIAIPQFVTYRTRARRTKALSLMGVVRSAQAGLQLDLGCHGASGQNLNLTTTQANAEADTIWQAGLDALPAATAGGAPGALVAATDGNGMSSAVALNIPQGIYGQCNASAAAGAPTYLAYAYASGTDRVFGIDGDVADNVYYVQDATWIVTGINAYPATFAAPGANDGTNNLVGWNLASK